MSHQMFHKAPPKAITIIGRFFKVLFWFFVITTPLLGVWLASSLAVYLNGPRWLAFVAGALLFPVLPTVWEIWVARRRTQKGIVETRYLAGFDRIILRTLFLNAMFITILLIANPASAFTALSARGDWLLDGNQSDTADHVRERIYWAADRLEWLYDLTQDNPYKDIQETDDSFDPAPLDSEGALPIRLSLTDTDAGISPVDGGNIIGDRADNLNTTITSDDTDTISKTIDSETATVIVDTDSAPKALNSDTSLESIDSETNQNTTDTDRAAKPTDSDSAPEVEANQADGEKDSLAEEVALNIAWPFTDRIHPSVLTMPESEKKTISKIAKYLRSKEDNPFLLAKAIHDYVVERVHYDFASLEAGKYPPYDARIVNREGSGVCAGYASLFAAIAKAAGFRCADITGRVRQSDGNIDGVYHAWNAIRIEGNWYLVDPTWDSRHAYRLESDKLYRTDYFLTPPAVFALDHFPMNSKWQLMEKPISRGEFIRQPMMRVPFYRQQMRLITPTRSQVTVDKKVVIEIENPTQRYMSATYNVKGREERTDCNTVRQHKKVRVTCELPRSETYQIILFSNEEKFGYYGAVGSIEAVRL